jgi:hypothetical protein
MFIILNLKILMIFKKKLFYSDKKNFTDIKNYNIQNVISSPLILESPNRNS